MPKWGEWETCHEPDEPLQDLGESGLDWGQRLYIGVETKTVFMEDFDTDTRTDEKIPNTTVWKCLTF